MSERDVILRVYAVVTGWYLGMLPADEAMDRIHRLIEENTPVLAADAPALGAAIKS